MVERRVRWNSSGTRSLSAVRVSSSPSRKLAAAPACSFSSAPARLQADRGTVVIRLVVRPTQLPSPPAPGVLWQVLKDTSRLVNLVPLDRHRSAQNVPYGCPQGLGAVCDHQQPSSAFRPRSSGRKAAPCIRQHSLPPPPESEAVLASTCLKPHGHDHRVPCHLNPIYEQHDHLEVTRRPRHGVHPGPSAWLC